MKPLLLAIIAVIFQTAYSQPVINFSRLPNRSEDTTTLNTSDLLAQINWAAIRKASNKDNGHYAYEEKDSLLTKYKYVKQGYSAHFEILSYKGLVVQYETEWDAGQGGRTFYFNKNVWLSYINERFPAIADSLKPAREEPADILKAYYVLVGAARDEYGFVCEYGAAGSPPAKRRAILTLLQHHRIDLIRTLVYYPNLQTKMYAIDALIYIDYVSKTDSIATPNNTLLTAEDWKMIYDLRDSKQIVITCGNMGSYKMYETPVSELLSEKAIADIPKWYESLRSHGWLR
jgi:hypothetical protein